MGSNCGFLYSTNECSARCSAQLILVLPVFFSSSFFLPPLPLHLSAHFPLSQTIAAKIGKPVSELVKLNANENVYGAPESVLKELSKSVMTPYAVRPNTPLMDCPTDASCFVFKKKKTKKKVTQTLKKTSSRRSFVA